MDYTRDIEEYVTLEIEVLKQLDIQEINRALNLLVSTLNKEGNVYVIGNGGSAATASHYQNDFNKGVSELLDTKFRFQCLSDNVATVTAIANDLGYDEIYRYQLKNRMRENDILIAISGSGNSKNILKAVEYAKEQKCKVIGLTGYHGGRVMELCDISLHAPVQSMQVSEDVHMILDHLMMSILCKSLCGIDHLRK